MIATVDLLNMKEVTVGIMGEKREGEDLENFNKVFFS